MIIVSGWIKVDPPKRDGYLEDCVAVVEQAREAPGCHDFSLGPDLLDDSRINVYERWESEAELMSFRQSGPDDDQQDAIKDGSVRRYEISSEGPA